MKHLILILLIFSLNGILISQNQYMPLKVGNSWTYTITYNMSYCCKYKVTVVSDTIINNKRYYKTSSRLPIRHVWDLGLLYYRVDTVSGNFFGYVNSNGCSYYPNGILIDSLSANVNNVSSICPDPNFRVCTNINNFPSPWGQSILRKRFQYFNGTTQTPTAYFINIGLAGSADGPLGEVSYDIKGCVVNGVVYGDTTLVSVIYNSSNVPERFKLFQNFPNPFNPNTTIQYSLSENSFVTLKVYDILGNEIAALVNEKQNRGNYNVNLSTVDYQLSSGIYFYRLEAGDFIETKRMIVLK